MPKTRKKNEMYVYYSISTFFKFFIDRGSLPFEQNGPKEDIDDLRVVVRICPL